MTKSHLANLALKGLLVLLAALPLASRAGEPLIVVEDRGGTSALPYYEALNLQPRANSAARSPIPTSAGSRHALRTRPRCCRCAAPSSRPAPSRGGVIEAPGPCGLSWSSATTRLPRAWLRRQAASLRERGAVGLVVNVETVQGLARLRALVLGVPSRPCPATTWPSAWACGTTRC